MISARYQHFQLISEWMKHFLGCHLSLPLYIWEVSFIVTPSCHIKMFTLSSSQWPALAVGTLKTCSYLFFKKNLFFYSSFYWRLHSSELIQHSACFCQVVQSSSVLIAACISVSHFSQKSHNFNTPTASKTSRIRHTRVEGLFFLSGVSRKDTVGFLKWIDWLGFQDEMYQTNISRGTCALTSPSFRVQENNFLSFSSSPGFIELAYVRAEQRR